MEIQEKLVKFKYHILCTFIFLLIFFSLLLWSPSFLTVVSYFWPLLLSTALFLAAIFFLDRSSAVPATGGVKAAAEGLLDYVIAAQPEETLVMDSLISE